MLLISQADLFKAAMKQIRSGEGHAVVVVKGHNHQTALSLTPEQQKLLNAMANLKA